MQNAVYRFRFVFITMKVHKIDFISALEWATLMEQVALGSSLKELYFGILTVQNEWFSRIASSFAIALYGEANFSRYFVPPY